tara:strand:- start:95 stop:448 length:354 start_codon:yes stop_codon:yes gene_type:complete
LPVCALVCDERKRRLKSKVRAARTRAFIFNLVKNRRDVEARIVGDGESLLGWIPVYARVYGEAARAFGRPRGGVGTATGAARLISALRSAFLDISSVRESHRFVFQSLIATGTAMSI